MSGLKGKAPLLVAVLVGVISGNYIFQPIIQESLRNQGQQTKIETPKEEEKNKGKVKSEPEETKKS